jgi:Glycosidases
MDRRSALALIAGVIALFVVVIIFALNWPGPLPTPSPSPPPFHTATAPPPSNAPSPTASAAARHAHDGVLDKTGLRHDSRETVYRTPGGAVAAGTPVMLRFRTFHDDATAVTARVYSVNAGADELVPMDLVATAVSCYEPALVGDSCDFWQTTLTNADADNIWYRFIVEDGPTRVYYADDTPALDGGEGAASAFVIDQSYALTVYEPDLAVPAWASSAVFYQIFPDRFRNGDPSNDPQTGDVRYDDPVVARNWTDLPEGYCRGYRDGTCDQDPHGRDYFGGDLAGITQELGYLSDLGVTAIYLNPIFDAASNHGYDTQDYTRIDPYFGTKADWDNLVEQANAHGMRIILDGVFNHMSSDSPFFDRYGHYDTVGACESPDSQYRDWFYFQPRLNGGCAGPAGASSVGYTGWAGVDSIPVLHKDLAAIQDYFVLGDDSIARYWLAAGASGWRLDVSGDPTFPTGWWETFRDVVKDRDPDALTVAEQWQKDTTLLRQLRGDRFDTTMNYRFRDAVLGFLAPGLFDGKGFPASGAPIHPADFAARMLSQQEDYPPAVYRSLLNLLDSHDTERVLWTLTPGAETTVDKEQNANNLAEGVRRLELATLIQFTMPGAPMIYYGDEVGLTGDDDPDSRRTYPWPDLGGTADQQLLFNYRYLAGLRMNDPALIDGDLRFLLVGSPQEGTLAYGRRTADHATIVAVNRSAETRTLVISTAGFVPDGAGFIGRLPVRVEPPHAEARDGAITIDLAPLSGVVLVSSGDLAAPAAPGNAIALALDPGSPLELFWQEPAGAASYNLYGSPLSGGGFVRLNGIALDRPMYLDEFLAKYHYFVVTALDAAGNESGWSNEVMVGPSP